jgi:hypothetical protein
MARRLMNNHLPVTRSAEITALFDQQLDKMFALIDHQMRNMDNMDKVAPDDRIVSTVLYHGTGLICYRHTSFFRAA